MTNIPNDTTKVPFLTVDVDPENIFDCEAVTDPGELEALRESDIPVRNAKLADTSANSAHDRAD